MADYNSDRTGSNIDAVLDKADDLTQAAVGVGGNVGIGTASPSAKLDVVGDINVSGGIYLGGTGAANKLDDYEEGTWTPVYETSGTPFESITMDASSATYTKVGNLVNAKALIRTDSLTLGSASGTVLITGLPFVATAGFGSTTMFAYRTGFVNAPVGGYIQSGGTYIILRKSDGLTSDNSSLFVTDMTTGTSENKNYIMMDITYQA